MTADPPGVLSVLGQPGELAALKQLHRRFVDPPSGTQAAADIMATALAAVRVAVLIRRVEAATADPAAAVDLALRVIESSGGAVTGVVPAAVRPFVRCFLDLSMGHLAYGTRDLLGRGARLQTVCEPHAHGWWVRCPEDESVLEALRPDLRRIVRHAVRWSCTWIRFDCNGRRLSGLPWYGGPEQESLAPPKDGGPDRHAR